MIYLKSTDTLIGFDSEYVTCECIQNNRLFRTLIPDFSLEMIAEKKPEIIIKHTHSSQQKYNVTTTNQINIEIFDDWRNNFPGYVVFLLYKCFDYLLHKKGKILLHSSSIALNNHIIVFFGNPGDGKTGIAIEACRKLGATFLANNRTVLEVKEDRVDICGVARFISIRHKDLPIYEKLIARSSEPQIFETGFTCFTPEELNLHVPEERDFKLGSLVKIRINSRNIFSRLGEFEAITSLFENSSKTQRGECLLFNGTSISPKFEDDEEAQRRLNTIIQLASMIPVYRLEGDIDYILKTLSDVA